MGKPHLWKASWQKNLWICTLSPEPKSDVAAFHVEFFSCGRTPQKAFASFLKKHNKKYKNGGGPWAAQSPS